MKAAMMAVVFFFSTVAQAHPKVPRPPDPPDPPEMPRMPDMPDMPVVPDLDIDIPEIDVQLPDFDSIAGAWMARGRDRDRDRDDDDDKDNDEDNDEGDSRVEVNDRGVKVYKMTPQPQRIHIPRVRINSGDDDRWDERDATAQAKGKGTVALPVKGPVTLQLRVQSGDVVVSTSSGSQVRVTLEEASDRDQDLALYAFGDRVQPVFRGRRTLRHGRLRVELPAGSRLDLSSMSGDLIAQRLAEVRVRSMSGDVKVSSVAKADIQTISGDVHIDEATGPVRLHTVSGHAVVATEGTPQIDFQSASGDMDWTGACGRDCHVNAETVSGELRFTVDSRSSFELSYTSHSGELRDELNLAVKRSPARKHGFSGGWLEASYGRGEGVIDADAFSGNLTLKKK